MSATERDPRVELIAELGRVHADMAALDWLPALVGVATSKMLQGRGVR
jgi:hypothetical protein